MEVNDKKETSQDELIAGTGFMQTLQDAIAYFVKKGYVDSLVPFYDHLACDSNKVKLWPNEIQVEDVFRFENSSDPGDQSILYAISVPKKNVKGLYVESYGLYHDDLAEELQHALQMRH